MPDPLLAEAVHIMLERFFGATVTISTGRIVPVHLIGQAHEEHDDPIKGGIRAQMGPIQKRSIAARD